MDHVGASNNRTKAIEDEFAIWRSFLNNVIGVAAFTLGLACLGTHSPSTNAFISLIFVSLMRWQGSNAVPPTLLRLRELAKDNPDFKYMVDSLVDDQLSWRKLLTKYCVFAAGFLFLCIVAISAPLKHFLPILNNYFGP